MTEALTTTDSAISGFAALAEAGTDLRGRMQSTIPVDGRGPQYLRLWQAGSPQEGMLTYGVDATEIDRDDRFAFNPLYERGWWVRQRGRVLGNELTTPWWEDPPEKPDFSPAQIKAKKIRVAQGFKSTMVGLDAPHNGVTVHIGGDSQGMVSLFGALIRAIDLKLEEAENNGMNLAEAPLYPVITLGVDSYENPYKEDGSMIYKPTAEIHDWLTEAQVQDVSTAARVVESDSGDDIVDVVDEADEDSDDEPETARPRARRRSMK